MRMRNLSLIERFTDEELYDQELDSRGAILGTIVALIGTLIWAYGDLIVNVLN
jgi:hypothetical protein